MLAITDRDRYDEKQQQHHNRRHVDNREGVGEPSPHEPPDRDPEWDTDTVRRFRSASPATRSRRDTRSSVKPTGTQNRQVVLATPTRGHEACATVTQAIGTAKNTPSVRGRVRSRPRSTTAAGSTVAEPSYGVLGSFGSTMPPTAALSHGHVRGGSPPDEHVVLDVVGTGFAGRGSTAAQPGRGHPPRSGRNRCATSRAATRNQPPLRCGHCRRLRDRRRQCSTPASSPAPTRSRRVRAALDRRARRGRGHL